MNKPEYSDLYKFIASLGVIMIASAVLLPWLILREPFDNQIRVSEISELTKTGQTLIDIRQNTALWFIKNILYISLIPAVLGLSLLIIGLLPWWRKQRLLDERDELENKKLEYEYSTSKMTNEQIMIKALEEIQEDLPEKEKVVESKGQVAAIQKYFRTEDMVITKFSNCYDSANVFSHQIISGSQVDFVVRLNKRERAIFDVKRVTNLVNISHQKRAMIDYLSHVVYSYNEATSGRKAYGIGIIIIGEENSKGFYIKNEEKITIKPTKDTVILIMTFTESEFIRLECTDLSTMIRNITNKG